MVLQLDQHHFALQNKGGFLFLFSTKTPAEEQQLRAEVKKVSVERKAGLIVPLLEAFLY